MCFMDESVFIGDVHYGLLFGDFVSGSSLLFILLFCQTLTILPNTIKTKNTIKYELRQSIETSN
jgi:hypothetical protein